MLPCGGGTEHPPGCPPLLAGVRWCWCLPLPPCMLSPLFPLAPLPCVLLPWWVCSGVGWEAVA